MDRAAGFAFVASATEDLANQIIAAFVFSVKPQTISLPAVNIGGVVLTVQGTLALLTPSVQFRPRTDGLVSLTLSVGGLLTLSTSSQTATLVDVVFSTVVDVPVTLPVENNTVFAATDLTQIVLNQLSVTYLSAPPLPLFQNAVASPELDAAITSFIRALAPLPLTVPLMASSINQAFQRDKPTGPGASGFPPYPTRFRISLSASRTVLRQFKGAITVAADVDGVTTGDETQLVDLTTTPSPLTSLVEQENYDGSWMSGYSGGPAPYTSAVVLVSAAVIAWVLANQVSPALDAGPLINDKVLVHSVTADLGPFDAGVPWGPGFGITANVDVSAYAFTHSDNSGYYWPTNSIHTPASATIYVKVVLYDRYRSPSTWQLEVVNASVSLPAWLLIDLVSTIIMSFTIAPIFTLLASAAAVFAGGWTQGILQGAEGAVSGALGTGLGAASVLGIQTATIPSTNVTCDIDISNYGFCATGAEVWSKVTAYDATRRANGDAVVLKINGVPVPQGPSSTACYYDLAKLTAEVSLAADYPYAAATHVDWNVVRKDTGSTVYSNTSQLSAPFGSSISVTRLTPVLQAVTEFAINVTIYLPGQILTYSVDVAVTDWLDRSHRFVHWTSRTWFKDPSKPKQNFLDYWSRVRPSRIHRTDFPGRCRRMSPPSRVLEDFMNHDQPKPLANTWWSQWVPENWEYLDVLPFNNAEEAIAKRHGILCDYCFFGGPTKTKLLVPVP